MKLEKALRPCSAWLSEHAQLCLLTLLLLLGLTLGLWQAQPVTVLSPETATRGGGPATLCQHASIAFAPDLRAADLSRILRAENAHIVYGPDEFGEYQLRFGSDIQPAQAVASLQARAQVQSITAHTDCP